LLFIAGSAGEGSCVRCAGHYPGEAKALSTIKRH
jgi:hypothetical protein